MTEPTLATAFLAYVAKIQEQRERIEQLTTDIASLIDSCEHHREMEGSQADLRTERGWTEVRDELDLILNPPTN